jgi:hypothetical protein
MDAQLSPQEEKLKNLLREAALLAAEIQAVDQKGRVPHFDKIEGPAHALGQELSRLIQTERVRGVAATDWTTSLVQTVGRIAVSKPNLARSTRWTVRWTSPKPWQIAVDVDGLFFLQRVDLGLDSRESTPGFKRKLVVLNAETRSLKRVGHQRESPAHVGRRVRRPGLSWIRSSAAHGCGR